MPFGRGLDYIAVTVDAFIRDDPAPVEGLDDIFLGSRDKPLGVCVFYPYDKIPSVLLGVEVVVQCCPDSAHMERPCR